MLDSMSDSLASNSWSVWMETYNNWCQKNYAECILLPIREAYEWKRSGRITALRAHTSPCFQFVKRMNGNNTDLCGENFFNPYACFQFVKRMNGNCQASRSSSPIKGKPLASNSWSVWMETKENHHRPFWYWLSCFQFVKRMNGNWVELRNRKNVSSGYLLPIREAYEWKQLVKKGCWTIIPSCFQFVKRMNGNISCLLGIMWITTCFQFVKRMNGNNQDMKYHRFAWWDLLPIREAYEWKPWLSVVIETSR